VSPTSRVRLAAVTLAAVVTLAGCSGGSPLTALKPYAASDGLHASVGDIRGLNLLVLTRGAGERAALTGTLDNIGDASATVRITVAGEAFDVVVPAGESVTLALSEGDVPIVLDDAPAAPGLVANVTLASGGASREAPVPVLDGTLPEYGLVLDALDAYRAEQT
jgi:hypothetical protein